MAFAQRSFVVASGFGLASILSVIVLGDESGYTDGKVQKVKLAVIEAEWETETPPASFTVFGLPNQEKRETEYAVKIPWLLGLIATRSYDEPVIGLKDILKENKQRIRNGMIAYHWLQQLRNGTDDEPTREKFRRYLPDLGYGLLLKRYTPNVIDATEEQIEMATNDTIPNVAFLFWTFRVMVACGFVMLFIFVAAFYVCSSQKILQVHWLHRLALISIPLPWIASESGWVVAEYGRQPWSIAEILPTFFKRIEPFGGGTLF